jgi:hypothetical protein
MGSPIFLTEFCASVFATLTCRQGVGRASVPATDPSIIGLFSTRHIYTRGV